MTLTYALPFSVASNNLTRGPVNAQRTAYETDMTGVNALADALSVSSSMKKLNIWDNKIGVKGATAIVDAAPAQMRTLCGDMLEEGQTKADLSGKKLGPAGIILVAWDLRAGFVSNSMTSVNLAGNNIAGVRDEPGVKAIANAICQSGSLLSIDLSTNNMDAECAQLLAGALNVSTTMTSLNLADNKMFGVKDKSGIQAFTEAVRNSTTLTALDISKTGLSAKDAPIIAQALSVSSSMTSLNLAGNTPTYNATTSNFNDMTGVKAIADALSVSSSMTSLKSEPALICQQSSLD